MVENWDEFRIINKALDELVENSGSVSKIKKALKYIISAGGKRTRPIIVLLSGKISGGSYSDVLNAALAVELIHTASLAHDDVIDRGSLRRNVKTLHLQYDTSVAILVGDWLISKSVELTSIYGEDIVKEFAEVGKMMSEGEVMDIFSTQEPFDEEDYFRCIQSKTAALFAFSAKNACRIVSDDRKAAENLFGYGHNLGMAYQLVDDLLEYLEIFDDKRSEYESRTLPMIYEKEFGFEEAIARTLDHIRKHASKSEKALDYFDLTAEREKLSTLIEYMTAYQIRNYVSKNRTTYELLEAYQEI
jgi:octaprenyl-diphosphate synthase